MRIFLYILKDYLKYVFGTVFLCIFLFVLFDFIHKSGRYFAKYNPDPSVILDYYIQQMPFQVLQALPIASLLGSIVVMLLLGRTNEITAMRAAGMTPLRIGAPVFAGALFLCLIGFLIGETVLPKSAMRMHYIEDVLIEGKSDDKRMQKGNWFRVKEKFFNFVDFDRNLNKLYNLVILVKSTKEFKLNEMIHAESATFNSARGTWDLNDISIYRFLSGGQVQLTKSLEFPMSLPIEPQKLTADPRRPDELSLSELSERVGRGLGTGTNVREIQVAYHVKIAFIFASFMVCFVGLKFGYKSERATETVVSVLLGIGLGVSYWFLLSAGRALANGGNIEPWLGAWLPNFVLGSLGVFELYRLHKT